MSASASRPPQPTIGLAAIRSTSRARRATPTRRPLESDGGEVEDDGRPAQWSHWPEGSQTVSAGAPQWEQVALITSDERETAGGFIVPGGATLGEMSGFGCVIFAIGF